MSDSNSIAMLERTSSNVYEADILNCSGQMCGGYDNTLESSLCFHRSRL
jgi:hypothetical protein